jgi:hypothetical protein
MNILTQKEKENVTFLYLFVLFRPSLPSARAICFSSFGDSKANLFQKHLKTQPEIVLPGFWVYPSPVK